MTEHALERIQVANLEGIIGLESRRVLTRTQVSVAEFVPVASHLLYVRQDRAEAEKSRRQVIELYQQYVAGHKLPPVAVVRHPRHPQPEWKLVDGNHRILAADMAGLHALPALVLATRDESGN